MEISAQAEPPSRQSSSEGSSKPRTRFSPSAGGCLQLQRVYRLFAPSLPAPRCIGNFSHGCGAAWGEVFYFFFCGVGPCLRAGDRGTLRGPAGLWDLQASASSSVSFRASSPHLQSMKAGRRLWCCPHQLSPQCPSPWPRGSALPGRSSLGTRSGEAPWRGRLSAGINKCEMMVCSSGSIQPFLPFPWLINLMAL